jgi:hypothetical protein
MNNSALILATCRQTTLTISWCLVNSKLGSKVENHEIIPGKKATATQEGRPCGRANGGKGHGRGEIGRTAVLSVE